MSRRRIKWIAVGSAAGLVLLVLLIAPAQAGRALKGSYHVLPKGVKKVVPDPWEEGAGETIDEVTRFFAAGDAHRLSEFDLRLRHSSPAPGAWSPKPEVSLNWTDLGRKLSYEVRVHPANTNATPLRVDVPRATVALPGDGKWYVDVQPIADSDGGHTTRFGPFFVDSSPAPAPILVPIDPPKGYSFLVRWTPVTDESGVVGYQVERLGPGTIFSPAARVTDNFYSEEQLGNGHYQYRVRAINGAGLLGAASNEEEVDVRAPMRNPGAGVRDYGIHANYTSFLHLWDLSRPERYARVDEVPADVKAKWTGAAWGVDLTNQTLVQKTRQVVGAENNTLKVAERLFVWLYDWADYDSAKRDASTAGDAGGLQPAHVTYDRRLGICGDLATLYLTMLRIAGVPARPMHGYLDNPDGDPPIGDFHVWVEVWVGASLRGPDPTDTTEDWMPVDVSGITGTYTPEKLMVSFGLFNPEYLALGSEADYTDPGWNSWAEFSWSRRPGSEPRFSAGSERVEQDARRVDLYFRTDTRERVAVEKTEEPPRGFREFFPDVKSISKKRIDYGVDVDTSQGSPVQATIEVRYPMTDAYANTVPWQSVIYTVYSNSKTLDPNVAPAMKTTGTVQWEDDFR